MALEAPKFRAPETVPPVFLNTRAPAVKRDLRGAVFRFVVNEDDFQLFARELERSPQMPKGHLSSLPRCVPE